MARSKSSQNTCNFLLSFLALWSMVSLVVIIVWATWPYMRRLSMSQCEVARQATQEKMEGAKVLREKNQEELMDQLRSSHKNQTELRRELDIVMEKLREANVSLMDSRQEKGFLKQNITTLKSETELHITLQNNLSSVRTWQRAHIDTLQTNLTWSIHHSDSCDALLSAANSQRAAAESQNKACKSTSAYLLKLLNACKIEDKNGSPKSNAVV